MKVCNKCEFKFSGSETHCTACGAPLEYLPSINHSYISYLKRLMTPSKNEGPLKKDGRVDPADEAAESPFASPDRGQTSQKSFDSPARLDLEIKPERVDFGRRSRIRALSRSVARESLWVTMNGEGKLTGTVKADEQWLKVLPDKFSLDAGRQKQQLIIEADAKGLPVGRPRGILRLKTDTGIEKAIDCDLEVRLPWWIEHQKGFVGVIEGIVLLAALLAMINPFKHGYVHPFGRNKPPELKSIEATPNPAPKGKDIMLVAVAEDKDGDKITYQWTTDKGSLVYRDDNHESVLLNTSSIDIGSNPVIFEVQLKIVDPLNGTDRLKKTITVELPAATESIPSPSPAKSPEPMPSPELPLRLPRIQKPGFTAKPPSREITPNAGVEPYRWAMKLFRENAYFKALEICEEALRKEPNDPDFLELKQKIESTIRNLGEKNNAPAGPRPAPRPSAPPASEQGGQNVTGESVPPRPRRKVKALYPTEARQAGITGTVVVEVIIDEDGDVIKANVIDGSRNIYLRQAAVEAARKSKFFPALSGGRAVRDRGTITYNFAP